MGEKPAKFYLNQSIGHHGPGHHKCPAHAYQLGQLNCLSLKLGKEMDAKTVYFQACGNRVADTNELTRLSRQLAARAAMAFPADEASAC